MHRPRVGGIREITTPPSAIDVGIFAGGAGESANAISFSSFIAPLTGETSSSWRDDVTRNRQRGGAGGVFLFFWRWRDGGCDGAFQGVEDGDGFVISWRAGRYVE